MEYEKRKDMFSWYDYGVVLAERFVQDQDIFGRYVDEHDLQLVIDGFTNYLYEQFCLSE